MLHAASPPSSRSMLDAEPLVIGRYVLSAELARGGMATVYVGRLHGDGGFKRVVAVKRLHAQFRTDDDLSTMFLDEARVAARIRHPNVVHAIDVALHDGEMFIVMEYVAGASLSQLMRAAGKRGEQIPFAIVCSVVSGLLQGLHAAHEAVDEQGKPLGIVHRDVSPQNVLVGADGVARVLDFGVAKAVGQSHVTREGEVKGKLAYMAPEQLLGTEIACQADVFSAGTILWELLTGRRLFYGGNDGEIVRRLLELPIPPPSSINSALTPEVDELVLRALERDPARRFGSASEMAAALEEAILAASPRQVGEWVRSLEGDGLAHRAALVAEIESGTALPRPGTTTGTAISRDHVPDSDGEGSRALRRPGRAGRFAVVLLAGTTLIGIGFGASKLLATPRDVAVVGAGAAQASPRAAELPLPATASASAEPVAAAASGGLVDTGSAAPAATASAPPAGGEPAGARLHPGSTTATTSVAAAASARTKGTGRPSSSPLASPPPPKGSIYSRD